MKLRICFESSLGWLAKAPAGRILLAGAVAASFGCSDLASGSDTLRDPLQNSRVPGWECLAEEPPKLDTTDPAPPYVAYVAPIFDFANPPSQVPNLSVAVCQVSDADR